MRVVRLLAALGLTLLFAGCGTNVKHVLATDSRLTLEADRVAMEAEASDPALAEALYAAEDNKRVACDRLNDAVIDMMENRYDFFDNFYADLTQLVVLIVPFASVERCADAMADYQEALIDARNRLPVAATPAATEEAVDRGS